MTIKITFSIEAEDLMRLDKLAEDQRRTRSSMIRWLVKEEYRRKKEERSEQLRAEIIRQQPIEVE